MASFAQFADAVRTIQFRPGTPGGELVAEELADFARAELGETVARGEGSPVYDLFVNGAPAASEYEVEVPGPILYEFSWWEEIIDWAIKGLVKRSPKRSGRFARSFVVIAGGQIVPPTAPISRSAEVIITNVQPYVRKIESGGMVTDMPDHIFDQVTASLRRKFGSHRDGFLFYTRYLNLPRGIHPLVPYILKRAPKPVAARQNRMSSAFRMGRRHLAVRKEMMPGQPITYPAIVMNLAN